ncbi:uncharacterized protein LOC130990637 [Salvia miltiorrhiza]|uniref:uncharacterized protein LOC130990637 n=1 Tax=Salvia miltiorrhiza TaxID=226208 RepID=UPI0025ACF56F|nr:uncharacterized protein LOC130990637 [Salvia miltiorrhiza]
MPVNDNSSLDSNSSSDVSHSNEFDEWEERVYQQNRQFDNIIENMILTNTNLFVGHQIPIARRRYCDRECELGAERLINDYFGTSPTYPPERRDATGRLGLSALQKCTAAMRVLAYGTSSDVVNEYLRMSSSATREALVHFVEDVISYFSDTYLRRPNEQDLGKVENQRSFWKMLHHTTCGYDMRSLEYQIRKHKLFAQHQESMRKDVERAFGVLQARLAFLRRPCLIWDKILMGKVMMACIIMHNMILEDERDTYQNYYDPTQFFMDTPTRVQTEDGEHFRYSTERIMSLSAYMTNRDQLCNREAHRTLQDDLIEHIWEKFDTDN